MNRKYIGAKTDLEKIELDNYIVEYEDNGECITLNSKMKSNRFHIDRERFKLILFLMLFFIVSLSLLPDGCQT